MPPALPYWRLSAFYFSYFALLGAIIPFWNVYLEATALSALQIGYLSAIMMGTKIVSPYLLGWIADTTQRRVGVIRGAALASLLCFALIFFGQGFWHLALVVASFTFFWNAVIGQYEAVTLGQLGEHYRYYGRVRAWGSVGFIASATGLGYLFAVVSIDRLPIVMTMLLAMIWLSTLLISETSDRNETEHSNRFVAVLRNPQVLGFLLVCLLLQFSHGAYYTFYSLYLLDYGYDSQQVGLLWGLAVFAELLLFLAMPKLMMRFGLYTLLLCALAAAMLRWLMIAHVIEQFALLAFAQLFHALSFACFHAIAVEWIRRSFAEHQQGQGQALYSASSFGAGGALGALVSGALWADNPQWCWYLAAAACALAIAIVLRMGHAPAAPARAL